MPSFQVTVAANGKFIFRTEDQPCEVNHEEAHEVHEILKAKFKEEDGYSTRLVIWPDRVGYEYI